MSKLKKAFVVAEGKTKIIHTVVGEHDFVIIENKDDITKNDDADQTQVMASKAFHATKTTCQVFQLLKDAGLPVAFKQQLSPLEFLAPVCQMIPLEVIIRRYAVGSYLKRFPNLAVDGNPLRFHRLVFELFLKTTNGKVKDLGCNLLSTLPPDVLESEKQKPVDDPFIQNPYSTDWILKHPKIPGWDKKSRLGEAGDEVSCSADHFLPDNITVEQIEEITRKVFLVLEAAWMNLGCRLIDFKIEFGIDNQGRLLVADVIDNDSWRLRTADWQEVSKQLFRDNHSMGEISEKYALVSSLTERFSLPQQAIVVWRGSDNDPVSELPTIPGIVTINVAKSGHKSPQQVISMLEKYLAEYPEGGVIIANVGLSNGLGPMLAARTSWPVISVPAGNDHHDIYSSLSMPSQVPNLTMTGFKNAVLAAVNILAQKNPVAYMARQYAIEEWEK